MKYLKRFNESKVDFVSEEEINDLLVHIQDMDVKYHISKPEIALDKDFPGRYERSIHFSLENFEKDNYGITDSKFWFFLDILSEFRSRLNSDKTTIRFGNDNSYIDFIYMEDKEVSIDDEFKLETLLTELRSIYRRGKTDFCYSMTSDINEDKTKITMTFGRWGEYTDRKFKGLFKSVDFSEFNIKKIEGVYDDTIVEITNK